MLSNSDALELQIVDNLERIDDIDRRNTARYQQGSWYADGLATRACLKEQRQELLRANDIARDALLRLTAL